MGRTVTAVVSAATQDRPWDTEDLSVGIDRPGLAAVAAGYESDLIAVRRHLHAHPELGRAETATTAFLCDRLADAGLTPRVLPAGTRVGAHVGPGAGVPAIALRADIDALPLVDEKDVPYRSTTPGVCHACGHDVHTAALLGAALLLRDLAAAGELPGAVRLIFQPAEELTPGGALEVMAAGVL